jgi:hypothetical protein
MVCKEIIKQISLIIQKPIISNCWPFICYCWFASAFESANWLLLGLSAVSGRPVHWPGRSILTPQFSRFKTPCFRGLVTERPIWKKLYLFSAWLFARGLNNYLITRKTTKRKTVPYVETCTHTAPFKEIKSYFHPVHTIHISIYLYFIAYHINPQGQINALRTAPRN